MRSDKTPAQRLAEQRGGIAGMTLAETGQLGRDFEWLLEKQHADLRKILKGWGESWQSAHACWKDQFLPGGKYGPDPDPEPKPDYRLSPCKQNGVESIAVYDGEDLLGIVSEGAAEAIRADERARLGRS